MPAFKEKEIWRKVEWIVAIVLSLVIVFLHFLFGWHAGGLWRDEIVSFTIASQPWSEIGAWLRYESFPGFFHYILHLWTAAGLTNDFQLRLLGTLIGLFVLGGFWLSALCTVQSPPLFSLVLFGLSPLAIRTTDGLRAYGLGLALILLTFGLMWKVVESPSPFKIFLAALAAVLSVQTLYQNAFFLLALGLGGMAVTVRRREWGRMGTIFGVGLTAALSLTLYAGTLGHLKESQPLLSHGLTLKRVMDVFSEALADQGRHMLWIWVACFIGAIIFSLGSQGKMNSKILTRERDLLLFCVVTLVVGVLAFLTWLLVLDLPTQSWYYIPLLAVSAATLDSVVAVFASSRWGGGARLGFVVLLSGLAWPRAWAGTQIRQTNIDLVSSQLEKTAALEDLIIVFPWYCGATFTRYYQGRILWTTLPPLLDYRLQGDVKAAMMAQDPIASVLEKIENTLKAGHRVWLVGGLPFLGKGQWPLKLPPAPQSQWGWNRDVYSESWGQQAAYLLQSHATKAEVLPPMIAQAVNVFENLPVVRVEGWKE
jgi:hypothetical protein